MGKKEIKNKTRGECSTKIFNYKIKDNTGATICEEEIALVIWLDSKPVYLLTTDGDCSEQDICKRRKKGIWMITISQQKVIHTYNLYMGRVDASDFRRMHCPSELKSLHRCWLKVFFITMT